MRFLNSPLIICCIDLLIWGGLTFGFAKIGAIPSPSEPREDGNFFRKVEGVRFLGIPTSKCSNFATSGPYSCRFHSRDNGDLYLTNLSQILKIHVDFRVICRHYHDNTPSISEDAELCDGSENRNDSLQFSRETREKSINIFENSKTWS